MKHILFGLLLAGLLMSPAASWARTESWTEGDGSSGATVYNDDGSVKYHMETDADGVKTYYHADGSKFQQQEDVGGITKTTHYDTDGKVSSITEKWTEGDGTSGSTVYNNDGSIRYHTETNADGETHYFNKDGSPYQTTDNKEVGATLPKEPGNEVAAPPKDTSAEVKPDTPTHEASVQNLPETGDTQTTTPMPQQMTLEDGTQVVVVQNPDGTTTIQTDDGRIIQRNQDGSQVITNADGSQIIDDGQGNVTFKDAYGNIQDTEPGSIENGKPAITVNVEALAPKRVWAQYDTYSGKLSKGAAPGTYTPGTNSQLAEGAVKNVFEGTYKGSVERAFMGERELAALERQEQNPSIFQQVSHAMKTAQGYVSATQRTVMDAQTRATSLAGKADTISRNFTGKDAGLKNKMHSANAQINKGTATLGTTANILGTNTLGKAENVLTADNPFTIDNAMDALDVATQSSNNMYNNQQQIDRRVDMWKK